MIHKLRHWRPVNITGRDKYGRRLVFHPECGDSHPEINGQVQCPVYAELERMLEEISI